MSPFFFLLEDSWLESPEELDEPCGWPLAGWPVAAGCELSDEPAAGAPAPGRGADGDPEELVPGGLVGGFAGAFVAGAPAAGAGLEAAAPGLVGFRTVPSIGGPLGCSVGAAAGVFATGVPPVLIICAPAVKPGSFCGTDGTVSPELTLPTEPPSPAVALAPIPKDGPAAPGLRTSVAETVSVGGFKFGAPACAAVDTSGFDFSSATGAFLMMLS